jgi:ABC-type transporter Mla subunit MlaD
MANKQQEADFFRIGIFVIAGFVLIVVAILAFSSGELFQKRLYIETYFNESVQGLSVGSAVKYRGIDIGYVKQIKLVSAVYPMTQAQANSRYGRYVYVLLSLPPNFIPGIPSDNVKSVVQKDVGLGLRVQKALTGLTGTAYLELNFSKPKDNPILPILWKPRYLYIPSKTSTLTAFGDSVQSILSGMKDVNFKKLFGNMQTLVKRSDSFVTRADNMLGKTQNDFKATLDNMKAISSNMRENPSALLFSHPAPVDPKKL